MFQPRYAIACPSDTPHLLQVTDMTGRFDTLNPSGWTPDLLAGATLTLWVTHTTTSRLVCPPFELPASDLFLQPHNIPFMAPDGVYTLHVRVNQLALSIPTGRYSLTGVPCDPTDRLVVYAGTELLTAERRVITPTLIAGRAVWEAESATPLLSWAVESAGGAILLGGTFSDADPHGAVYAAGGTTASTGETTYTTDALLTPRLRRHLGDQAARLTYCHEDTPRNTRDDREALAAWSYLFFDYYTLADCLSGRGAQAAEDALKRLSHQAGLTPARHG